jgi:hypothetical protein
MLWVKRTDLLLLLLLLLLRCGCILNLKSRWP